MPSSVFDLYLKGCSLRNPVSTRSPWDPLYAFCVLSQAQKTRLKVTAGWPDLEGWAANCLANPFPISAEL